MIAEATRHGQPPTRVAVDQHTSAWTISRPGSHRRQVVFIKAAGGPTTSVPSGESGLGAGSSVSRMAATARPGDNEPRGCAMGYSDSRDSHAQDPPSPIRPIQTVLSSPLGTSMWPVRIYLLLGLACVAGCTTGRLRRRTINQWATSWTTVLIANRQRIAYLFPPAHRLLFVASDRQRIAYLGGDGPCRS